MMDGHSRVWASRCALAAVTRISSRSSANPSGRRMIASIKAFMLSLVPSYGWIRTVPGTLGAPAVISPTAPAMRPKLMMRSGCAVV